MKQLLDSLDSRSTTELVASYRSTIAEKHARDVEADKELRKAILNKIERTRECGMLIADAHGDLRAMEISAATDFLSKDAVQSYLKFAKSNPEPINDLENALRAVHVAMRTSGALEFPHGHGPEKLHTPDFVSQTIRTIQ